MEKNYKVSVVICSRNEEKYIARCVESILNQTFRNFELIIIDDASTDGTRAVVERFLDPRIRFFSVPERLGIARARNLGISKACTPFLFFTDADCFASTGWLQVGFEAFEEDPRVLAVEGFTYYEEGKSSLSHKVVQNTRGNLFMTCNMGYRTEVLKRIGGFDTSLANYLEDGELAIRIKREGLVCECPQMIVIHQAKHWTLQSLFERSAGQRSNILVQIKHGTLKKKWKWRVVCPLHLLYVLFPPSLLIKVVTHRITSFKDIAMFPMLYLHLCLERVLIWKTALETRTVLF